MFPLAAHVLRSVRAHRTLARGDRVVVAVSGGADSLALLHLLVELSAPLDVTVAGLVHLHHGLRGADADADAALCQDHAARLALPLHLESADVGTLARRARRSVEWAGREARYECFARALDALGGTRLATGHTLDDQAETVLLRLARGAGLAAIAGIRRTRGQIVRPLLDVRHADLVRYLSDRGLPWREDASNADCAIARNRVRHRVIPVLAAELSPCAVEALGRAADIAAHDAELLEHLADTVEPDVLERGTGTVAIRRDALCRQPPAIRRRLVRRALARVSRAAIRAVHVERVLALAGCGGDTPASDPAPMRQGARAALPGVTVVGDADRVVVSARSPVRGVAPPAQFADEVRHLPVPGVLSLVAGVDVLAEERPFDTLDPGLLSVRGSTTAVVDAALVGAPLGVRFRRPGDRLRPLGMMGRRKLQDVFVDRKVPRAARDRVPLVVDHRDRIVWVAGHVVSEDFRVSPVTTRVLLLKVQPSGG